MESQWNQKLVLGKINKFDKPRVRLIRKKEKKRRHIANIRNKRGGITLGLKTLKL